MEVCINSEIDYIPLKLLPEGVLGARAPPRRAAAAAG